MKKLLVIIVVMITNVSVIIAQSSQCPRIVQNALVQMGTNCANLDTNSACYGHLGVSAEVIEEIDITQFSFDEPADRAPLTQLAGITTAPLDLETGEWGISVLRLTANVPNSLPGQGVVFIMLGDAKLENAVAEENMYSTDATVTISSAVEGATLFSFPTGWGNRQSVEVGTLALGETVEADAISDDFQWVRVGFVSEKSEKVKRASAWIQVADIEPGDLSDLAVINADSRTPMQVFSVQTGFGQPQCTEQPPSQLLIQGPSTIEVDLTANGVDFRLTSTVSIQVIQNADGTYTAIFIPVTGSISIPDPNDPDNPDAAIQVNASQFLQIPFTVDPDTNEILVDPEWIDNFATIKQEFDEATENGGNYIGATIVDLLGTLQALPENLLNYSLEENTPIIIQPSGVGNPIPEFSVFDPSSLGG